jgi:opacity protein-like surface antigen
MTHTHARRVRGFLYLLLFCFAAAPCLAQDPPTWEFFGGYSLEKADVRGYYKSTPIIYSIRNQQIRLNGWEASFTENRNRWLGGTAEINGHYYELQLQDTTNRGQVYSVLYGPRFSYRKSRFIPFAHLLAGAAYASVKVTPVGPHDSGFSFALAGGGGVDVRLAKKMAARLVKVEYFWADLLNTQQDRLRTSFGLIFYW